MPRRLSPRFTSPFKRPPGENHSGDHALVTCRVDGGTITVKAEKSFDRRDGAPIGVDFADASIHVFDKDTGDHIR
jgi:hypothetical protein